MKDYMAIYDRISKEMEAAGISIGNVESIKINSRAKSFWGRCTYSRKTDSYTIEISNVLITDDVDDTALINTLAHEMLHTAKDCMNHGKIWKGYAATMNRLYGYDIKRVTAADEKGVKLERRETYHYIITCTNCGSRWRYMRNCNIVKCCQNNMAKCSCGSNRFIVEHF